MSRRSVTPTSPAGCIRSTQRRIARFEAGALVSRGLPFEPPGKASGCRWIPIDRAVHADLADVDASFLVLLAFCDAWRDEDGRRPAGTPVGWVLPVGEPLARMSVRRSDGTSIARTLRRRFEVGEGIVGWGSMAFLALPHLVEEPVDWRGPHPRQGPGRLAPTGHAGPLTIVPGSWGGAQTGVSDNVPSPGDDLMLWLHAIDVRDRDGGSSRLRDIELAPLEGDGRGRLVVVAAITAYVGAASPLRWSPRRTLRVRSASADRVSVDLGLVARRSSLHPASRRTPVRGWGGVPVGEGPTDGTGALTGDELVEVTAAEDAVLHVGEERVPIRDVRIGRHAHARLRCARRASRTARSPPRGLDRRRGRPIRRVAGPMRRPRRPLPPAARPSQRGQPGAVRGPRCGCPDRRGGLRVRARHVRARRCRPTVPSWRSSPAWTLPR